MREKRMSFFGQRGVKDQVTERTREGERGAGEGDD